MLAFFPQRARSIWSTQAAAGRAGCCSLPPRSPRTARPPNPSGFPPPCRIKVDTKRVFDSDPRTPQTPARAVGSVVDGGGYGRLARGCMASSEAGEPDPVFRAVPCGQQDHEEGTPEDNGQDGESADQDPCGHGGMVTVAEPAGPWSRFRSLWFSGGSPSRVTWSVDRVGRSSRLLGAVDAADSTRCAFCGHPGVHARTERPSSGGAPSCEDCDACWLERQRHERPPHHG